MIKFLLGVAIVAFTSFCGYLLSKGYRKRKAFFKQFKEFNERFLSEISYYRRPLKEFAGAYAYNGEFQILLESYFQALDARSETSITVCEKEEYSFLTEEDRRVVEDYFLMLGRGDSASQKGYFTSVVAKLSAIQTESETAAKRYGDLYVKIGFLCGLLILILIV